MDNEQEKSGAQAAEAMQALERFVVENDDLLALESRIGRFNIFDALGIARAEIRHSNFLAFILDPAESHGQGQLFLKALLMDLLKQAHPQKRPLSPIDLDGADLRDVEVKREWNNIDLLITCKQPQFAIVIENKVGSLEHSNQLSRYQRTIRDHYPDVSPLYVYLTPEGDDPSEEKWLPYTYTDIHRVLKRVRDTYLKTIGDEVLVFLNHYLGVLETRLMNDDKLDELCRRIYTTHRLALKLIWDRVGNPESAALDVAQEVLKADANWHVFYRSKKCLEFVPKSWVSWLPQIGFSTDPQFWNIVIFRLKEDRIQYQLQVYETNEAVKRKEIVTKMREECERIGFRPGKHETFGRIAHITANNSILEWDEEDEPNSEAIRAAVKKTLDDLSPRLEQLVLVLKPLCKRLFSTK